MTTQRWRQKEKIQQSFERQSENKSISFQANITWMDAVVNTWRIKCLVLILSKIKVPSAVQLLPKNGKMETRHTHFARKVIKSRARTLTHTQNNSETNATEKSELSHSWNTTLMGFRNLFTTVSLKKKFSVFFVAIIVVFFSYFFLVQTTIIHLRVTYNRGN